MPGLAQDLKGKLKPSRGTLLKILLLIFSANPLTGKPLYEACLTQNFLVAADYKVRLHKANYCTKNETTNFKTYIMFNAEEFSTDFPKLTFNKPRIHNIYIVVSKAVLPEADISWLKNQQVNTKILYRQVIGIKHQKAPVFAKWSSSLISRF